MNVTEKMLYAAREMDWQQVVLNGGPPCFALMPEGRFCARARQWEGHSNTKTKMPYHKFVSFADLLEASKRDTDRLSLALKKTWVDGECYCLSMGEGNTHPCSHCESGILLKLFGWDGDVTELRAERKEQ